MSSDGVRSQSNKDIKTDASRGGPSEPLSPKRKKPAHLDVNSQENIDAKPFYLDFLIIFFYLYLGYLVQPYTGWVLAVLTVVVIQQAKVYVLRAFFGLESLTCMDYFFLYDNYKNRANIVAVTIYNKFDLEQVKRRFKERAFKFPRMKQRLVRHMGEYFWQTMSDEDFDSIVDDMIIDLKDEKISNEEELAQFVSKESQLKNCLNLPQWRVFLKEDY